MSEKNSRFPKPWCVVENADSFVVEDVTGYVLTRVPFLVEGRRGTPSVMSKEQARQVAEAMVKTTDVLMPTRLS